VSAPRVVLLSSARTRNAAYDRASATVGRDLGDPEVSGVDLGHGLRVTDQEIILIPIGWIVLIA
jgi:hypothetical protein